MVVTQRAPINPMQFGQPQEPDPASLPPDVYWDREARQLMRTTYVHTGFETEDGRLLETPADVEKERRSGRQVFETHKEVPRPCVIPSGWSLEQIEAERKAARMAEQDFLHPTYGWLAFGRKREREVPANMGTGSIQRRIRRQAVNVDPPAMAMPHDGQPVEVDGPLPTAPADVQERRGPGRPPKPREEAV